MILGFISWIVILGVCWLGWQLLRQNGRILLRLDELESRLNELEFGGAEEPEGLPVGSDAPAFELPDVGGKRQSLAQFRGQAVLLIFFNPDCGFCREMLPKLAKFPHPQLRSHPMGEGCQRPGEGSPLVLVISSGAAEENRQLFAEHKVGCSVLLQSDGEIAKAYQAQGTPTGYLISTDGKIASKLAMGAEALLSLAAAPAPEVPFAPAVSPTVGKMEKANGNGNSRANRFSNRSLARSKIKRDGLNAGTPAPDFRLPRLDGRGDLTLSDLRGKRVLLVFSSPDCGPCEALAPELETFHRTYGGEGKIAVVMVSKGEPNENWAKVRKHGLTFPVVVQQQWEISRRYAMFATPIAYWIDERGVVAGDVAVGTDGILGLLARLADSPSERKAAGPQTDPEVEFAGNA